MSNTSEKIKQILLKEYGLVVNEAHPMTMGVGGDTFLVETSQGKFVYKIADENEMNHLKAEPELCDFLYRKGISVSEFIKNNSGSFTTVYGENRVSHLQKFVEGKVFSMNKATDWFMEQSPVLLGKIHTTLQDYKELPMGIGQDFFRFMTPENAKNSYQNSYEMAKQNGELDLLEDLEFRIRFLSQIKDWEFDLQKLTYCNTHGDYTVNQMICGEDKINAVIDWTCACRHPVVWEITRSFFYAEQTCANGGFDERKFKDYVERYCSEAKLTQYDKDNLLKLYFYQIAVCDYYSQYLYAEEDKKEEYLLQAKFATEVLKRL